MGIITNDKINLNLTLDTDSITKLQYLADCGILSKEEASEKIYMIKEQLVYSVHPKDKIYERGDGTRFFTKYRVGGDTNNELKPVSCVTRSGLINKLYDIYFDSKKDITITDLFMDWIKIRTKRANKYPDKLTMNTVLRNIQHWNKYVKDYDISKTPIKKITTEILFNYFKSIIDEFNMTREELSNMKIIFTKAFSKAKDENIINLNPLLKVDFYHEDINCRTIVKKADGSKVFLEDEAITLFKYLSETETVPSLAIQLSFQLGLRIGELVALKWSDINNGEIFIQRMEHKNYELNEDLTIKSSELEIVDRVKCNRRSGYREIQLTDKAIKILDIISSKFKKENDEFIFNWKGTRMDSVVFTYHLENCCKKAAIQYKSSHNIRRTTASTWCNVGVPLDEIRRMLGHKDIMTTLMYIFNTKSKKEILHLMNQA